MQMRMYHFSQLPQRRKNYYQIQTLAFIKQFTFLKRRYHISFFLSDRKNMSNVHHIVVNWYLEFYNFDTLSILIVVEVKIYRELLQTNQSRMTWFLKLYENQSNEIHPYNQCQYSRIFFSSYVSSSVWGR